MALGVPGRLRPPIFSTFGTTRVVGRQTKAPAAFTPGEIPGTHFQRLSRPQSTWIEQVSSFNYSGSMISYEKELHIDNKLHNNLKFIGTINNVFRPHSRKLE